MRIASALDKENTNIYEEDKIGCIVFDVEVIVNVLC
jgi:hypothetical protein